MYIASENRYEKMKYFRCGNSGLMLPADNVIFDIFLDSLPRFFDPINPIAFDFAACCWIE